MATKIIKSIPLEDVANTIVKEESIIFERYNMVNNPFAKHNCKNLSKKIKIKKLKNVISIHNN